MIDPLVSLAFSVYSNRGAYAVLLGSGISRASGVPTGWEVVLDLIRKVAKLEAQDCEPDPAAWFRKNRGTEPDYSKLLDGIAKTPAERQQLLRGYFEPTEDERSQGIKLPNAGHKAIAQLVATGYLRVIITTNFDRLMEKALDEIGVATTVISTTDQLIGALPLAHSGATVIKLHGDYLDTRIKNTEQELAAYDKALDGLLDRVFDEYGLIVSGWSGDWDIALRAAIERCPSRRFTTFWATRSALSERAKKLAESRKVEILQIKDANQFFEQLWEKVRALSDLAATHPLSAKMAVATVKRYLVDPVQRIRLRDLLHEETEKLASALTEQAFPGSAAQDHPIELLSRIQRYDALTDILAPVVATGCYWGEQQHSKLWARVLQRIVNLPISGGGLEYLVKLRKYPSLRLFYASGVAAVAANNYSPLAALLMQTTVDEYGKIRSLASVLYPMAVVENDIGHLLPGMEKRRTPLSDYIFGNLREQLREYLPSDEEYSAAFDRFEYFLGLVHADIERREFQDSWWGPVGRFSWRGRDSGRNYIPTVITNELKDQGKDWPPLKFGFFSGSLDQATLAVSKFNAHISRIPYF